MFIFLSRDIINFPVCIGNGVENNIACNMYGNAALSFSGHHNESGKHVNDSIEIQHICKDIIREVSLYVFQRKTRCTGPRLGTRTVVRFWTTYVNHAESELSVCFETCRIFCAFCAFVPYLRSAYHPCYETRETPRNWTDKAAQVSRFFLVNEQRAAKPSRPMNNVAWTTYMVHGRNTHGETSLLLE